LTITGVNGPPLFSLSLNACACDDSVSVTHLRNKVIGRIQITRGCCEGGRFFITYPQELPLDHKLLLIVAMCMMQLSRVRIIIKC
jgi:hypothetical protein